MGSTKNNTKAKRSKNKVASERIHKKQEEKMEVQREERREIKTAKEERKEFSERMRVTYDYIKDVQERQEEEKRILWAAAYKQLPEDFPRLEREKYYSKGVVKTEHNLDL